MHTVNTQSTSMPIRHPEHAYVALCEHRATHPNASLQASPPLLPPTTPSGVLSHTSSQAVHSAAAAAMRPSPAAAARPGPAPVPAGRKGA